MSFNETYRPPHVEPAYGNTGATDFPFEKVFAELDGEAIESEPLPEVSERDTAKAVGILLRWICRVRAADHRGVRPMGTRALACLWIVDPAALGNLPAKAVAEKFGIPACKFSTHAAEFSRAFKIQNAFQTYDGKNDSQPKALLHETPSKN